MEILLHYLSQGLSFVIPFVSLLGILIFVHELGHFMVARWCGVRVEVFSLGFGKKILKFKRGDTTYALSLIPLGGYVKMFGEQPGADIKPEEKSVSFTHKNVWQRIAIVIAGPLMNFIFAVFLFMVVSINGENARKPVVGDVKISSAAFAAGLRSGDTLVKINSQLPIASWEDVQKFLSLKEKRDLNFDLEVRHAGTDKSEIVNLTAVAKENPNILSRYDFIGDVEGFSPLASGTTVGVPVGSPLHTLGLRTGDSITSINGQTVKYWRDLESSFSSANAKEALTIEVSGIRDGEKQPKTFAVTLAATKSISSYAIGSLGIETSDLYLARVVEKSPAQAAGLQENDRLISINNTLLLGWDDVINSIKSFDGKNSVSVSVKRDNRIVNLSIVPQMSSQTTQFGSEEKRYTIGIVPFANIADAELIKVKAAGLGDGFVKGVSRTWDFSVMTVLSFVRLFQNKISPKHIGGVISIGQAAGETFKMGMTQFMQMMAIISVNLFVLNLLPIPVLDGGHLLFYIIEVAKGAPVSLKKMEMAQQVGLALLMGLMIFALFNDFTRLFGL